jgi:Lipocalin-like domain
MQQGMGTMTRNDIVGVYRQIGEETVGAGGVAGGGETRRAQIMYTPDGYMAVVSGPSGRRKVSGSDGRMDLNGATAEERAEAAKGMVCYAGSYELKDDTVLHHVETALNPNMVGQTVIRRVHLSGPDLTLSSVPDAQGSFRRIRWRRV